MAELGIIIIFSFELKSTGAPETKLSGVLWANIAANVLVLKFLIPNSLATKKFRLNCYGKLTKSRLLTTPQLQH